MFRQFLPEGQRKECKFDELKYKETHTPALAHLTTGIRVLTAETRRLWNVCEEPKRSYFLHRHNLARQLLTLIAEWQRLTSRLPRRRSRARPAESHPGRRWVEKSIVAKQGRTGRYVKQCFDFAAI
jgi:hypothetical protein